MASRQHYPSVREQSCYQNQGNAIAVREPAHERSRKKACQEKGRVHQANTQVGNGHDGTLATNRGRYVIDGATPGKGDSSASSGNSTRPPRRLDS
jgi:hypothetical protein